MLIHNAVVQLARLGATEAFWLRGTAKIESALHPPQQLDAGLWLFVRWAPAPDLPLDGLMQGRGLGPAHDTAKAD